MTWGGVHFSLNIVLILINWQAGQVLRSTTSIIWLLRFVSNEVRNPGNINIAIEYIIDLLMTRNDPFLITPNDLKIEIWKTKTLRLSNESNLGNLKVAMK